MNKMLEATRKEIDNLLFELMTHKMITYLVLLIKILKEEQGIG